MDLEKPREEETDRGSEGPRALAIQDWGLIDYARALDRQMALVDLVQQGLAPDTLIFCTHRPVVTLGRGTREGDVFGWQGRTVQVNRGGRATYHGPSQIVVYPILDLSSRGRDLHKYFRLLEEALVRTVAEFGISAAGHVPQVSEEGGGAQDATGVWVGSRKLASIGIGVRKWVSFHGLALNVAHDPSAFAGMRPCGFATGTMISMEELLGALVDRERVTAVLRENLLAVLATENH